MKKILVFLAMMSVVLGISGIVMAAQQDVFVTINGVVDFDVSSTLNFGDITPGSFSDATSVLTLGETNTEDLTVEIYLEEGTDLLFTNIVFTTMDASIGGLELGPNLDIGEANAIDITIDDLDDTDTSTEQNKDITATLTVPTGTLSGLREATIIYTVTSPAPEI